MVAFMENYAILEVSKPERSMAGLKAANSTQKKKS